MTGTKPEHDTSETVVSSLHGLFNGKTPNPETLSWPTLSLPTPPSTPAAT